MQEEGWAIVEKINNSWLKVMQVGLIRNELDTETLRKLHEAGEETPMRVYFETEDTARLDDPNPVMCRELVYKNSVLARMTRTGDKYMFESFDRDTTPSD